MKKVEIILDKVRYLQRFESNETYIEHKRSIQSSLHDASEFRPVFCTDQKSFDLITAVGYMKLLCEWVRWNKQISDRTIELHFFEEQPE